MFELAGMDAPTRARFAGYPSVRCHERLAETAYDQLLANAFAVLLPLSFATANNALLEGYRACLPVFASRIPGIADYVVDGDAGLFDSAEEFWRKYDALACSDLARLQRACVALQGIARERFAWPTVRQQLQPLYAASGACSRFGANASGCSS